MMNNNKRINHQILDQLVLSNWGLPHIHNLPTPLAGGQEKSFAEQMNLLRPTLCNIDSMSGAI